MPGRRKTFLEQHLDLTVFTWKDPLPGKSPQGWINLGAGSPYPGGSPFMSNNRVKDTVRYQTRAENQRPSGRQGLGSFNTAAPSGGGPYKETPRFPLYCFNLSKQKFGGWGGQKSISQSVNQSQNSLLVNLNPKAFQRVALMSQPRIPSNIPIYRRADRPVSPTRYIQSLWTGVSHPEQNFCPGRDTAGSP